MEMLSRSNIAPALQNQITSQKNKFINKAHKNQQIHDEHFHSYHRSLLIHPAEKKLSTVGLVLMYTHFRNPFNSVANFPNQTQWNATDNDFEMNSNSMGSGANPTAKVNNHQKTAERMAEDESVFLLH
jgi:deoxyribodipyrimidine photolyase